MTSNSTNVIVVFDDVSKAVLPLSGLIPVSIMIIMYKFYYRPFRAKENGGKRMELIDTITSALLLGNFLCHSLPMATEFDYHLYIFSVILGFMPFVFLQYMWKPLQENPSHDLGSFSSSGGGGADVNLEKIDMSDMDGHHNYIETGNDDMAKIMPTAYEAKIAKRYRRIIAVVVYLSIILQAGLDILFIMYNPKRHPTWQLIFVFYINKVIESFVMCSMIIHARVKSKVFFILSSIYASIVLIGCIPALLSNLDPTLIVIAVEHPALKLFVGITAGGILWVTSVFRFIDVADNPKPWWGAIKGISFTIALFVTWATGYWG